ncbi:Protein of unknown function [Gryllus bimaculatus]|nr:Protein of unknown function [Gryllus bimaculatus]
MFQRSSSDPRPRICGRSLLGEMELSNADGLRLSTLDSGSKENQAGEEIRISRNTQEIIEEAHWKQ